MKLCKQFVTQMDSIKDDFVRVYQQWQPNIVSFMAYKLMREYLTDGDEDSIRLLDKFQFNSWLLMYC